MSRSKPGKARREGHELARTAVLALLALTLVVASLVALSITPVAGGALPVVLLAIARVVKAVRGAFDSSR